MISRNLMPHIASYIDHTLLAPFSTGADIANLCREALQYGFAAVCVPPYYVREAKQRCGESHVKTATVIGFPFGYSAIAAKAAEMTKAIAAGADELDMVVNLAALRNGDWSFLETEISAILPMVRENGRIIKLIIESGMLTEAEIIRCCDLYSRYPVHFLKTSTGYAEKGATVEAVRIMRKHLPPEIRIKASGGIRTFVQARAMLAAGAARLGCSAGVRIVKEEEENKR
ncbi:deoxyribose-phosphate aldolase [Compostibacter hankyongensis]|uniref:Deoxyribose-phosphate aldolase n=2 Tax=Compostibacter hankyongensis TaxID=1007089 RepID=A0ABP8G9B8_9BACT